MQGKPGPAYQEKRDAVSDADFLRHLTLAEEGAVTDPIHRERRFELDGIVFDRTEEGVMLTFTVDGEWVVCLAFADLYNA